jgi:hypothetical protein
MRSPIAVFGVEKWIFAADIGAELLSGDPIAAAATLGAG